MNIEQARQKAILSGMSATMGGRRGSQHTGGQGMDVQEVVPKSSKRPDAYSRHEINTCKICGNPCMIGSQHHVRTTCSDACATAVAKRDSRKVVDYVMPMEDVERYLDLMDMAQSSDILYRRRLALVEASTIKRDL